MTQQSHPLHPAPDPASTPTAVLRADLLWDPPEQLGTLLAQALDPKESNDDHA